LSKIKVEDMDCFEQVAKVIGVANAKRELFIALNGYNDEHHEIFATGRLSVSFYWDGTPQLHDFWDMIYYGVNPYNPHNQ
jgi:hypothetical protein